MRRGLLFPKRATRSERRAGKQRRSTPGHSPYHRRLVCEALEARTLLSVSVRLPAGWHATPIGDVHLLGGSDDGGQVGYTSPYPDALTPNQIRGAYGLGSYTSGVLSNGISFGGIQGDGRGQTIAIVDAYDDPNAAERPECLLHVITACRLSAAPAVPLSRSSTRPAARRCRAPTPTARAGPGNSDWEEEESLDIEWAHAMAPMANIILFEANDATMRSLHGRPDRRGHARRGGRLDELERT